MATILKFTPKPDITTFEMAEILRVILDSQSAFLTKELFGHLTAIRHFEEPIVPEENLEVAHFLLLSSTPPKT